MPEWIVDGAGRPDVTDCEKGILKKKRYLIHDRDPLYTTQFLRILAESGIDGKASAAYFLNWKASNSMKIKSGRRGSNPRRPAGNLGVD
jgi:hypothetical protein